MFDLDRFRQAQDAPHAGFLAALDELRAGRKTGHWIWYVFPQLAGLGQSATAVHYGLAGRDEAAAYLRDPVLGERLVAAAAIVRARLSRPTPARRTAEGRPEFAAMAEHAGAILDQAAAQGYGRCAFTERHLRLGR